MTETTASATRSGPPADPGPPVYVVAQISIHDRDRYEAYAARFAAALGKAGGQVLAADYRPEVMEGSWNRDRLILLRFADEGAFRAWAQSDLHRDIASERIASTDGVVLMVHGLQ